MQLPHPRAAASQLRAAEKADSGSSGFPKRHVFSDITTLLKDDSVYAMMIDALSEHYLKASIDLVLGMEAPSLRQPRQSPYRPECRICSLAQARQAARRHGQV